MSLSLSERVVLHVGCGYPNAESLDETFRGPGWREVRFDINPGVAPDILGSITNMSMIPTASVDAVWSSHNIEHLYAHEVPLALREFYRVLKPGGFALITLPDLQTIAELVVADKLDQAAYVSPAGPITPRDMIYGFDMAIGLGNTFMAHSTGFTASTLRTALERAGFTSGRVDRVDFDLWARVEK